jgi:choline dehydrogenase
VDHHDVREQVNLLVHGFRGINSVSMLGFPRELDHHVTQASQELGGEFSFNQDMNSGRPLGVGEIHSCMSSCSETA